MKTFRTILAGLFLLWSCVASPAMLVINELNGFNVGGESPPVVSTFIGSNSSTSDTANYSFAAEGIGTAAADRFVVVGFVARCATARSVSSVTIAGNATTQLVQVDAGSSDMHAGLYGLLVTSGTTATIAVNFSGTCNRLGLGVWTINGLASQTPSDTMTDSGSDPATGTIDVQAGGCIIAIATTLANTTTTWTGVTEDYDAAVETSQSHSGAHDNFAAGEAGRSVQANFATAGTAGTQRLAAVAMR